MTQALVVHLDGDGCWPDLADTELKEANFHSVALLRNGTSSGKHSVSFRVQTQDGETYIAQVTLKMLQDVVTAMNTRAAMDNRAN